MSRLIFGLKLNLKTRSRPKDTVTPAVVVKCCLCSCEFFFLSTSLAGQLILALADVIDVLLI